MYSLSRHLSKNLTNKTTLNERNIKWYRGEKVTILPQWPLLSLAWNLAIEYLWSSRLLVVYSTTNFLFGLPPNVVADKVARLAYLQFFK